MAWYSNSAALPPEGEPYECPICKKIFIFYGEECSVAHVDGCCHVKETPYKPPSLWVFASGLWRKEER